MPSPFPGMDPYLEDPTLWRGFHHSFAEEIKRALNGLLTARYFADIEVRIVIEEVSISTAKPMYADAAVLDQGDAGSPETSGTRAVAATVAPVRRPVVLSDEVKLRSVRVIESESGDLVTSIEVLSPFNKRGGDPTREYLGKRNRILLSTAHLVELDLLRGGLRPGPEVREPPMEEEYVVLLNRATGTHVRTSEIWPVALSDPLPVIPVPLISPDPDVPLDIGAAVRSVYATSAYERRIDYGRPVPGPPLREPMAAWLRRELRGATS